MFLIFLQICIIFIIIAKLQEYDKHIFTNGN